MRIRHKPYAKAELAAWPAFVTQPATLRGQWHSAFAGPARPLRLELGCGKGQFLAKLALRDADYNHLGVDIKNEMLVVAKRNIQQFYAEAQHPTDNVRLTCKDVEHLDDILSSADTCQRIYINFCNPWYKSGHAKHRLTHPRQLLKMRDILVENGEIYFKTDDDPLFNDSLRYFSICGFAVEWLSRDLHQNEPDWNIRTEHEEIFSSEGIKIKACIARMQPAQLDRTAIARMKTV